MPDDFLHKKINISKKVKWGFVIGAFLLIGIVAQVDKKDSSPNPAPVATQVSTQPQEKMNLAVRETTTYEASGLPGNQPVIAIRNLNSFDWKDCNITMNGEYMSHLDFIDIPSELKENPKDTHDSMVITEANFYKSDGSEFDSSTQRPLTIAVVCHDPYGSWGGAFEH